MTECDLSNCHYPASAAIKLGGLLRHVCERHTDQTQLFVPPTPTQSPKPISNSMLYPLEVLAEHSEIHPTVLRKAEANGMRVRRFQRQEWIHGADFISFFGLVADESEPAAEPPF